MRLSWGSFIQKLWGHFCDGGDPFFVVENTSQQTSQAVLIDNNTHRLLITLSLIAESFQNREFLSCNFVKTATRSNTGQEERSKVYRWQLILFWFALLFSFRPPDNSSSNKQKNKENSLPRHIVLSNKKNLLATLS